MLSKLYAAETCNELRLNGITDPRVYDLDPDGKHQGLPPIQVFCDHNGTAILGHDTQVEIQPCASMDCFQYQMHYLVHLEQMLALMHTSLSCSQSITFDCYQAPLKV